MPFEDAQEKNQALQNIVTTIKEFIFLNDFFNSFLSAQNAELGKNLKRIIQDPTKN